MCVNLFCIVGFPNGIILPKSAEVALRKIICVLLPTGSLFVFPSDVLVSIFNFKVRKDEENRSSCQEIDFYHGSKGRLLSKLQSSFSDIPRNHHTITDYDGVVTCRNVCQPAGEWPVSDWGKTLSPHVPLRPLSPAHFSQQSGACSSDQPLTGKCFICLIWSDVQLRKHG